MTLAELKSGLEAATGPDRYLDMWIENVLGISRFQRDPKVGYGDADYDRVPPKPLTASIDAAVALVEEKLPGCRIKLERAFGTIDGWYCEIAQWKGETFDSITAEHTFSDNGALAIMRAFVAAWEVA